VLVVDNSSFSIVTIATSWGKVVVSTRPNEFCGSYAVSSLGKEMTNNPPTTRVRAARRAAIIVQEPVILCFYFVAIMKLRCLTLAMKPKYSLFLALSILEQNTALLVA
jgi:hypothetical protein